MCFAARDERLFSVLEKIKAEQIVIRNMLSTVLRRLALQVQVIQEELPENISLPANSITSLDSMEISLLEGNVERKLVSI